MANDSQDVVFRIAADTSQLTQELQGAREEFSSAFAAMGQSLGQIGPALAALDKSVGDLNAKLGGGQGLSGLVGEAAPKWQAWALAAMGVNSAMELVGKAASFAGNEINKLVGYLPRLLEQTAIEEKGLRQMAHSFGMTVEGASALSVAAKDMGTSLGAVNGAMFRLTMQMEQAGGAPIKVTSALSKLGLSIRELNTMTKDVQFLRIMEELSKLDFGERQTRGMELFGRSWKTLSRMASEDMKKALEEAKEFGLVYTDQQAKIATKFADTMEAFDKMTKGFKMQVANYLMPWATALAGELMEAKKKIIKAIKEVAGEVNWDELMGMGLKEVTPIVRGFTDQLVTAIKEFGPVLVELVKRFKDDLWPAIRDFTKAMNDLAIVGFKQFVSVLKETVLPVGLALLGFFRDILEEAKPFVEMMGGALVGAINALGAAIKGLFAFFEGMPEWVKDAAMKLAAIATAVYVVEKALIALKAVEILGWITSVVTQFGLLNTTLKSMTLLDLASKFKSWIMPTGELARAVGGLGRAMLGGGVAAGVAGGAAAGAGMGGAEFAASTGSSLIADVAARAAIGDQAWRESWLSPGQRPKLINGVWRMVGPSGEILDDVVAGAVKFAPTVPARAVVPAATSAAQTLGQMALDFEPKPGQLSLPMGGFKPIAYGMAEGASGAAGMGLAAKLGLSGLGGISVATVAMTVGAVTIAAGYLYFGPKVLQGFWEAIKTLVTGKMPDDFESRDPKTNAYWASAMLLMDRYVPGLAKPGTLTGNREAEQRAERLGPRGVSREEIEQARQEADREAAKIRDTFLGEMHGPERPPEKQPGGETDTSKWPEWAQSMASSGAMTPKEISSLLKEDEAARLTAGGGEKDSKAMLAFQNQARNIQIKVAEARAAGVSEPEIIKEFANQLVQLEARASRIPGALGVIPKAIKELTASANEYLAQQDAFKERMVEFGRATQLAALDAENASKKLGGYGSAYTTLAQQWNTLSPMMKAGFAATAKAADFELSAWRKGYEQITADFLALYKQDEDAREQNLAKRLEIFDRARAAELKSIIPPEEYDVIYKKRLVAAEAMRAQSTAAADEELRRELSRLDQEEGKIAEMDEAGKQRVLKQREYAQNAHDFQLKLIDNTYQNSVRAAGATTEAYREMFEAQKKLAEENARYQRELMQGNITDIEKWAKAQGYNTQKLLEETSRIAAKTFQNGWKLMVESGKYGANELLAVYTGMLKTQNESLGFSSDLSRQQLKGVADYAKQVYAEAVDRFGAGTKEANTALRAWIEAQKAAAAATVNSWQIVFDQIAGLGDAFSNLAETMGGAFGGVGKTIGSILNQMSVAWKSGQMLVANIQSMRGKEEVNGVWIDKPPVSTSTSPLESASGMAAAFIPMVQPVATAAEAAATTAVAAATTATAAASTATSAATSSTAAAQTTTVAANAMVQVARQLLAGPGVAGAARGVMAGLPTAAVGNFTGLATPTAQAAPQGWVNGAWQETINVRPTGPLPWEAQTTNQLPFPVGTTPYVPESYFGQGSRTLQGIATLPTAPSGNMTSGTYAAAGKGTGSGWGSMSTGQKVGAGIGAATAAVSAYGSFMAATDDASAGKRALGGGMSGMATGASIGGMAGPMGAAIGAAAGFIVGAIAGAMRKPGWADVQARVGDTSQFKGAEGQKIELDKEQAKAIEKDAKEKFGGSRQAAEVYNLGSIIQAGGGLSEKNFDTMTKKLRDAFSMMETGKFSVEQTRKTLDENFSTFANHVLESGKVASKGFVELITLNKKFGTESKQIQEFVTSQTARAATALGTIMQPLLLSLSGEVTDAIVEQKTKLAEAQEKLDDIADDKGEDSNEWREQKKVVDDLITSYEKLTKIAGDGIAVTDANIKALEAEIAKMKEKGDSADEIAEKEKELIALQEKRGKQALEAQSDLDRAARLTMATFNASVAAGKDWIAAVETMGPTIDQLQAAYKKLGTEVPASLQTLIDFRQKVADNKPLVESAGALNELTLALSNIGGLNADTMKDLEAQGAETFQKLIDAGFTENESLQQMKGYLESVRDAHEQLGVPIDENTQKLIDQATQQGILKDSGQDMTSVLRDGMEALILAVGGKLPEAYQRFRDKAKESAADAAAATEEATQATEDAATSADDLAASYDATGTAAEDAALQAELAYNEMEFTKGEAAAEVLKKKLIDVKEGAKIAVVEATRIFGDMKMPDKVIKYSWKQEGDDPTTPDPDPDPDPGPGNAIGTVGRGFVDWGGANAAAAFVSAIAGKGGTKSLAVGNLGGGGKDIPDWGAGTPTILHGREMIVPEAQIGAFTSAMRQVMAQNLVSGSGFAAASAPMPPGITIGDIHVNASGSIFKDKRSMEELGRIIKQDIVRELIKRGRV